MLKSPMVLAVLVLSSFLFVELGTAFVLHHTSPTLRSRGRVSIPPLADSFRDDYNQHSYSRDEIEEARKLFERLALNQTTGTLEIKGSNSTATASAIMNRPFPLTAQMERLRTTELQLLQALDKSDDALQPLVELWIKEKAGEGASKVLHQMMMNDVCPDIRQEEKALRKLVQDCDQEQERLNRLPFYSPHHHHPASVWVEPHARLAVLLFSKQEYDEAMALCDYVLFIKPWHFEIANLFRVALLRVGNKPMAIRVTRDLCLPPLHHMKRRTKWIAKMTQLAKERMLPPPPTPHMLLVPLPPPPTKFDGSNLPPELTTFSQTMIVAKPFPMTPSMMDDTTSAIDFEECDMDNPNRDCFQ